MLSLHGFQPSFGTSMGTEWTVRRYEIAALHRHAAWRNCSTRSLKRDPAEGDLPSHLRNGERGKRLCFDTRDFSPEELSVIQVSRNLRVCDKTQKKPENHGKVLYRILEFRRVFDLPEGVNLEEVSCSIADNGKLYIQAPVNQRPEAAERMISTDSEDYLDA